MNESAVYNEADLERFHRRLTELRSIVHQKGGREKRPEALTKLLERRLNECSASSSSHIALRLSQYPAVRRGYRGEIAGVARGNMA